MSNESSIPTQFRRVLRRHFALGILLMLPACVLLPLAAFTSVLPEDIRYFFIPGCLITMYVCATLMQWNWKCPACKNPPGRLFTIEKCESCEAPLK